MKKFGCAVFFTIILLLPAGVVHGAIYNVVGTWNVTEASISTGGYQSGTSVLVITSQQGRRFEGHVEPQDAPYTNFYGVLNGRKIYLTFWDSTSFGRLNKLGNRFTASPCR